MKPKHSALCFTLLLASTSAMALSIPPAGTEGLLVTVATDGEVIATYQGYSAFYSDDLVINGSTILNNQKSTVGTAVDLGSFKAGTVLDFSLIVHNTGDTFYSGSGSLNTDGKAHVRVQNEWAPATTLVGFEDIDHGKFDYNDFVVSFSNTLVASPGSTPAAVPIPGTAWLLGSGILGLASMTRRRKN